MIPAPPCLPQPPNAAPSSAMKTHVNTEPSDTGRKDIRQRCRSMEYSLGLAETQGSVCVVLHHPVKPVLQDGPMCGLVALQMAGQLLDCQNVDTMDIFNHAKGAGFSLQGEMFSAQQMCTLATDILRCKGTVYMCDWNSDSCHSKKVIIRHIARAQPVLVPYDKAGNNEPCCRGGHSAHWALLMGMMWVLHDADSAWLSENCDADEELPYMYFVKPGKHKHVQSYLEHRDTYVLALQGKSKHVGLWPLVQLLQSNQNLKEVGPKIAKEIDKYLIPEGGVHAGLCGQIVLLSKR